MEEMGREYTCVCVCFTSDSPVGIKAFKMPEGQPERHDQRRFVFTQLLITERTPSWFRYGMDQAVTYVWSEEKHDSID